MDTPRRGRTGRSARAAWVAAIVAVAAVGCDGDGRGCPEGCPEGTTCRYGVCIPGGDAATDHGYDVSGCLSDEECRDGDPCNGEERCDPGTGACAAGTPAADGTGCGEEPRRICLGGTCGVSECGDGFVDPGAGESCDPPSAGSCSERCRRRCTTSAECEDGNACTSNLCDAGECASIVFTDGSPCGAGRVCCGGACTGCCTDEHCSAPTPACCGGVCRACCADDDCDDGNQCTADRCVAAACRHDPVPDLTACSRGLCCAGACVVGASCCRDEDCTAGCRGEARPCDAFIPGDCADQIGCTPVGGGECVDSASPMMCDLGNEVDCAACGCTWLMGHCHTFMFCAGKTEDLCIRCGCNWSGGCTGAHQPCEAYVSRSICGTQGGCEWSTCVGNRCT